MRPRIISLACLMMVAATIMAQGIQMHQYWLDSDFDHHKTVGGSATLTVTVSLEGLSPGVHFFNHRAMDNDDTWGTIYRTIFYIPSDPTSESTVQRYEYWIDGDYDNRKSGNGSTSIQATVDISRLSAGAHFFNYRAKSSNGSWGTIYRELFYIPVREVENPQIVEYEYWIDDDFENKWTGTDVKDVYQLTINISKLSVGEHLFSFRAKNTNGEWSQLYQSSFTVEEPPAVENITFADAKVKAICIESWDTDHDGELSKQEAAAVTSIGTVFKNNEEITSFDELEFFTGLTSIPNNTFYNCAKLASVVIPANVTDLGTTHPFLRCIALRSVKVADDNATYDSRNNCNAIIETATNKLIYGTVGTAIPSTVKEIGPTAFALCSTMTEITLPEGLQKIDQQAFYGCTGLKSVTIPASVTMIEKEAFTQCYSIQAIMVAAGNTVYDSRNGCNAIIETATNTLIVGCRRTDVPATVTSIGEAAFASQSNLTQITLPEGLVSIGKNAFWDCKELRLVSIPSTVTAIGQFAFEDCENLTDVHSYIEEPFAINNNVFTTYETTTLYVPYGTAALYRQTDGWKNFQSIVEMDPPMTAEAGEVVDLGLAVKWADRNLGATDMTSTGTYFAWGDTEARTSYNEADYVFNGGNFPRNIIGTEYDAARQLWGGEWRMPTYEEVQELIDACTWTYTTRNGVNGYLVESLVNDHYIFLPTPGYKEGTTINSSSTYYWTGSPSVNNLSKAMSLTGTGKNVEDIRQYLGALIRPVYNIVVPSSIEMLTVKNVTVTSAGVDVTLSGDLNDVDLLGLTYGKSAEELTISDKNDANHKVTSEISARPFFYFTALDANTTYYVRAYMKKTDGSYVESETISFKTLMDMSDFVSLIAKSYTREYGEENPEFEYEVTEGTALGTPTLSCDATKWSSVGEYVIAINTSTMSNSVVETTTGTLTIVPKGIATATLTVADSCAYTGQPIRPDVTVQLDGRVLTEGTDYILTFTNNFMPGIASLTIMGARNYTGTVTKTFVIFTPTAIGDVDADATKFDVYDMSGRKIRRHVTNIEGLPKGVYIIGGRKRAVK